MSMKETGEKIAMVTAYDAPTAAIVDQAGVDIILVGDSVGNVIQGRANTLPVTMDEMIYHTKLVSRGLTNAHLCGDMPFMSFQVSTAEAVRNAGRFVKEASAESVKFEITKEDIEKVYAIQRSGIPVMGHIGLRPQTIHNMGGYKPQGREDSQAQDMLETAKLIAEAGAYALVLESIPQQLAKKITKSISIPTIGIGAGPHCDGQVLVIHDLVGLSAEPLPRFVKKYANLREAMEKATKEYVDDVKKGAFPKAEHSYD